MKAIVYHADAHFAWGGSVGDLYKRLFKSYLEHCHKFGVQVVHLTLEGHPGWGDENRFYANLDPVNVMFNREECFTAFLETAPEDVYWFSEPDYRIKKMWPALETDLALCYRHGDAVPLCPAWRLATTKAYPAFRKWRDMYRELVPYTGVGFDWHGDSLIFAKTWRAMGKPRVGDRIEWEGVKTEIRNYAEYLKPGTIYGKNYFGRSKLQLVD